MAIHYILVLSYDSQAVTRAVSHNIYKGGFDTIDDDCYVIVVVPIFQKPRGGVTEADGADHALPPVTDVHDESADADDVDEDAVIVDHASEPESEPVADDFVVVNAPVDEASVETAVVTSDTAASSP